MDDFGPYTGDVISANMAKTAGGDSSRGVACSLPPDATR